MRDNLSREEKVLLEKIAQARQTLRDHRRAERAKVRAAERARRDECRKQRAQVRKDLSAAFSSFRKDPSVRSVERVRAAMKAYGIACGK